MGKRKLGNLVNLGSWSNYKKLPTYKKYEENKENVSNIVRGDIQSDSTHRILPKWMPYLLLQDSRVKERYTNQFIYITDLQVLSSVM